MSTDFDSKAFGAVSDFFGNEQIVDGRHKDVTLEPIRKNRNRLGVGATGDSVEEKRDEILDEKKTRHKILTIGNKRRRHDESDDEEDKQSFTDDDEDEGGRTSIQKKVIQPDPAVDLAKKSKKKKGKKERKAEKNAQQHTNEHSEHVVDSFNVGNQETSLETNQTNETDPSADRSDKTKKRRKVRSKQKNIRKDTRPSSQKPDHLRIGAKTYAGRPITKETREFLNLPESRTLSLRRQKETNNHNPQKDQLALGDGNLAIDDLLGDSINTSSVNSNSLDNLDDIPDSGQLLHNTEIVSQKEKNPNQTKPRAKKKKSKFKNLRS